MTRKRPPRLGHLANPAAQAALADIQRDLSADERADLLHVMGSKQGRRFYYRLVFLLAGIETESFDSGIRDGVCLGVHMARNEGRRSVGLTLLQEAQRFAPELWVSMLAERLAAGKAAETQRANIITAADEDSNDR